MVTGLTCESPGERPGRLEAHPFRAPSGMRGFTTVVPTAATRTGHTAPVNSSSLTASLLRREILVNDAALHDDQKILVWVGNYVDTLQRIAVDQKQVASAPSSTTPSLPAQGLMNPERAIS